MFLILAEVSSEKIAKPYKVSCSSNTEFLSDPKTCELTMKRRNFIVMNIDGDVKIPLKEVILHIQLFKWYNEKFRPFVVNIKFNLCEVLSKNEFRPYISLFIRIGKRFSNTMDCPLEVCT